LPTWKDTPSARAHGLEVDMAEVQEVVPGLYRVPLGVVNAYLLVDSAVTVIDTGTPGSEDKILGAVRTLGKKPGDVNAIIVTHCHADHSGSLAALKEATGAPAWMHPADAALVRSGVAAREMRPAPGLANRLLFTAMRFMAPSSVSPAEVEHSAEDGDELPFAGGLQVFHVPGHCAGQIALVWPRHGGVLVAADAASNMAFPWQKGLGYPPIFEDLEEGKRSLRRLAQLEVEVFGHGGPILGGAGAQLHERFGNLQH